MRSAETTEMDAVAIATVLGGRRALGKGVKNPDDLVRLVRAGLPVASLKCLAERIESGRPVLARCLGISPRRLTHIWSAGSRLTATESDRVVRLAAIYSAAVEMIGDECKAAQWLRTGNRALGGERPIDRLDTDIGARVVGEVLGRTAPAVSS